jgi:hypothetical protein
VKILSLILVFLFVFLACDEEIFKPAPKIKTPSPGKELSKNVVDLTDTVTIAAVGDIMLGTAYPDKTKLPADSAENSFNAAINDFKGSAIVFGNLEGTLLDSGVPASYKKKLATAFLFKMPTRYGHVLKNAGFNLISIANNHISDFGSNGYSSTMRTLDALNIHYAGLITCPTTAFEVHGIKYGFCAFAPNSNTMPLLDLKIVAQTVRELKDKNDIVIVSFHGGAEGAAFEHVPFKNESYLGTKRGDVHAFAHCAVDAGADFVFGNGPHVGRAIERYKNRLIAYSLGNFCTYKSVSVSGPCGLAPLLKVQLNKQGEFLKGRIVAFKQSHLAGLVRDSLNTVTSRIKQLTGEDFPESGLEISQNGTITIKNEDTVLK